MKTTILSTVFVLASVSQVLAQTNYTPMPTTGGPIAAPPSVVQRHASTLPEGVLRGWADVARSAGDYNYNTSLANINQVEAWSRSLDTAKKSIETYFESRRMNREYVEAERGPRPTLEDINRYAKLNAPKRLSLSEYEPALGLVFWPAVLQREEFAPERAAIDQVLAARTAKDGLGSPTYQQVRELTAHLSAKLKAEIGNLSPAEYAVARRFLNSLEYEVQLRPQHAGIAAR